MSTVTIPERQQFVFTNVSWHEYLDFEKLCEGRNVRLTYDRGRLEVMTISALHDLLKMLIHDFLVVLAKEFGLPRRNCGSMTFRREDLERGLEPDQCYYLISAPAVRGKVEIDLSIDPPPDLAIEIEVSRSILDRLAILAALGIPEVWRYDERELTVLLLQENGEYVESDESRCFAGFPVKDIHQFLRRRGKELESELLESFEQWVRQTLQSSQQ